MDAMSMIVNTGRESVGPTTPKRTFEEGDDGTDKRPAKRSRQRVRYDYDDMITVLVGPEKAKFTAHKDMLCGRSEFFKLACSKIWQEGRENVVPLPEVEEETFQAYMDLIYNLPIFVGETSPLPVVKFYVLGDFLVDIKARDKALRRVIAERFCPGPKTVSFIWDHTTSGSLLRQSACDGVVANLGVIEFATKVKHYPAEFVQKLAVKLSFHAPAGIPYSSARLQSFLEAQGNYKE